MRASDQDRISLPQLVDPSAEVRDVIRQMFAQFFPILAGLGGLVLVSSIWRTRHFGWQPLVVLYVLFFLVLVVPLGLRKHLPLGVVSLSLCAVGIADGVVSALAYGFASGTLILLSISTVAAGIFFGIRRGLYAYGISIAGLLAAAWLLCTGAMPLTFDPVAYLQAPVAWAVQITHFALLTLLAMIMIHSIERRLFSTVETAHQRTLELHAANRSLRAEVSARARTEQELGDSEAQYRLLAQHMNEVVLRQDMTLAFRYVSPSITPMLGYSVDEAMGLTLQDLLAPDSFPRAMAWYQTCVDRSGDVPLTELECVRKDGSSVWGELALKLLRDDRGEPVGYLGVLRDVSDRRRAQAERERMADQLRQSEKLEVLGQLAGGIAHDFNNQLAGMMGYAELLAGAPAQTPQVREAAEVILKCGQRAAELTGKLLAFARKGAYQAAAVNMHDLVREVAVILERSIDKTVAIRMDLSAPAAVVIGDATQLQNALLNLALNARDAMPGGGQIRFASRLAEAGPATPGGDRYLELAVQDDGVGMDAATLERIFEPFFTTKAPGRGTGMGLAAVHGTITAHNGSVTVESHPGLGTTFRILLPLPRDPAAAVHQQPEYQLRGSGRILLVEDEPVVQSVVKSHLSGLGYDVSCAQDGAEAVELFSRAEGAFDLVLLDLVLPRMDGASVFATLRAIRPDVKVLLMSGHADERLVSEMIGGGAIGLIRKPFALSLLSGQIARALHGDSSS
jgi:two-component system, cell cycle sensor histidine kinase and response regulator CckA